MTLITTVIIISYRQISAQRCKNSNWVRRPYEKNNVTKISKYHAFVRFFLNSLFNYMILIFCLCFKLFLQKVFNLYRTNS